LFDGFVTDETEPPISKSGLLSVIGLQASPLGTCNAAGATCKEQSGPLIDGMDVTIIEIAKASERVTLKAFTKSARPIEMNWSPPFPAGLATGAALPLDFSGPTSIIFSDYEMVAGCVLPRRIESELFEGRRRWSFKVNDVEFNGKVEDGVFTAPSALAKR
jgi:hypothetical protein